jgi:hypothetical protein
MQHFFKWPCNFRASATIHWLYEVVREDAEQRLLQKNLRT